MPTGVTQITDVDHIWQPGPLHRHLHIANNTLLRIIVIYDSRSDVGWVTVSACDWSLGGQGTMSFAQAVILGTIAGLTIFLGLPVGRLRVADRHLALLNAFAVGILLFLFVDIMEGTFGPVEEGLG